MMASVESGQSNRSKDRSDAERRALARQARALTIDGFHEMLVSANVSRAFLVQENGEFNVSHPALLAPIRAFCELSNDFDHHEALFMGREEGIPTVFFAFIHDTRRGLAQGGLRFTHYANIAAVLTDGLRLAQGMTRKNALAGLWWGGGKGIVPLPSGYARPEDYRELEARARLFAAYGRFVASLGGVYYTAEDVGTNTPDMDAVLTQNRFVTCISRHLGGSGNPSPFTARGVYRGMQAAWQFLKATDSLQGVRVAVQGAGHVGTPLIEMLDEAGALVWVSDPNRDALESISRKCPRVVLVQEPDDIFDVAVDIFAPCGPGAQVNSETIPRLKSLLICGAANNILKDGKADAELLRARGITFVPDYLVNRMGITNCCDEWQGYLEDDITLAAERVYPDTLRVLKHARNMGVSSVEAANHLADIAASELHPLLGHRGRRLIDHLVTSGWLQAKPKRTGATLAFVPSLHEPPIRLAWERENLFRGSGYTIAATPLTTAAGPNLASFLPALLLDVRARAVQWVTGKEPRRVLGSDHGGLALQLAVERELPHEKEAVGRGEFVERCRDFHNRNDAAIRFQLHQAGVGFNPDAWLDPMSEAGRDVCRQVFMALWNQGAIVQDTRLTYRCIHCQALLVSSDVKSASVTLERSYTIAFAVGGRIIETNIFLPEILLGAVGIAVQKDGPYGDLAGLSVTNPLLRQPMRIVARDKLNAVAELIVPAWSQADELIAREEGIGAVPMVYDESGNVRLPEAGRSGIPQTLTPEDARPRVLERLGSTAVERSGRWSVDAQRCRRCQGLVFPVRSPALFVEFDRAVPRLRRLIESGVVEFSDVSSRDRVFARLDEREPWCISRQGWWGNEVPTDPEEVLSPWFSVAALALRGAGWPAEPMPKPVDEVFVEPDVMLRWVIPAQLIALQIAGGPAFRRVNVHGALHMVERKLNPLKGVGASAADEERFRSRTTRSPMRRSEGNVVEPGTLVRRFGGDALRLGILLCVPTVTSEPITMAESNMRRARQAIRRLAGKITGLYAIAGEGGGASVSDRWLVGAIAEAREDARRAYIDHRLDLAAERLVDAIDAVARYAAVVAHEHKSGGKPGAVRRVLARVLRDMHEAFSPVCPFILERLMRWTKRKTDGTAESLPVEPWLTELVRALDGMTGADVELTVRAALLQTELGAAVAELESLTSTRIKVLQGAPRAGDEGALELRRAGGDNEAPEAVVVRLRTAEG